MSALACFALFLTQQPQPAKYVEFIPYKVLGWRSSGRYLVLDSPLGGNQGPAISSRVVADANTGLSKMWKCEEDSGKPSIDAQSKSWMKQHSASGSGKVIFQFKGQYFTPSKEIPSKLPVLATFKVALGTYSLRVEQTYGNQESTPGHEIVYRRAKFVLSIRRGEGAWKVLHRDAGFQREALAYGIDRIILSPSGRNFAVVLSQYNYAWFEGWNVAAAGLPIAGRLP
jgi:hypothetical protein